MKAEIRKISNTMGMIFHKNLSEMLRVTRRWLKQFLMSDDRRTRILARFPTNPMDPMIMVRRPITRENWKDKYLFFVTTG